MLVYCFGSFLLQDMFVSLQVFAFEGQNMTFTVNVLLTCILNRCYGDFVLSLCVIFVPYVNVFCHIPHAFFTRLLFAFRTVYICYPFIFIQC